MADTTAHERKLQALQKELTARKELIESVFASVTYPFESMRTTVDSFQRDVTVTVRENKYRWSDEACRVYFQFGWDEKQPLKVSFNHGSGGWNPDFDPKDIMAVQIATFTAAKKIMELGEQNAELIRKTAAEFSKICSEMHEVANERNAILRNAQEEETKAAIKPLVDTFEVITAEEIIAELDKPGCWNKVDTFTLEVYKDGFQLSKRTYEREKYGVRGTYKLNDNRVASKDIMDTAKSTVHFRNTFGLSTWDLRQLCKKRFTGEKALKEFEITLGSFKKENETV